MAIMASCSLTYFKRKLVGWKQEFDNRDLSRSQEFTYVFASISPFTLKKNAERQETGSNMPLQPTLQRASLQKSAHENLSLHGNCSSFSISSHSLSRRISNLPRSCKSHVRHLSGPCHAYIVNILAHLPHLSLCVLANYLQEYGNYRCCCKHFCMGHF